MANEEINNQSAHGAKNTADEIRGLYDTAKSTVGQAYGAATKRATSALEDQKGTLAEGLTSVASSIKQVGENLNTVEPQNVLTETTARYSDSLAQQVENLSGYFERKNVGEMVRDVEMFARRYPAYFVGGAVALGFVAARFLKSSNPDRSLKNATNGVKQLSEESAIENTPPNVGNPATEPSMYPEHLPSTPIETTTDSSTSPEGTKTNSF